jgi:hypothetical protein
VGRPSATSAEAHSRHPLRPPVGRVPGPSQIRNANVIATQQVHLRLDRWVPVDTKPPEAGGPHASFHHRHPGRPRDREPCRCTRRSTELRPPVRGGRRVPHLRYESQRPGRYRDRSDLHLREFDQPRPAVGRPIRTGPRL